MQERAEFGALGGLLDRAATRAE